MDRLYFESAKEMICWLIDNEGREIIDSYGRRWKYEKYSFYFKDISIAAEWKEGVFCLHLFKTYLQSAMI